ncbi:MAG: threonine-phosphate decarboxylase [Nitrospirae bacterium CG22_combo_CG10-13_8_21_14_all_44_11]|nr:MAG: threonine-phosphate decarboxylase [Nitrospirae bacterium CG22_combo_CG10-13_8_21_14_all_44_11]
MQETHGGNIYILSEKLRLNEKNIIDFSASINPLGIPRSAISAIKDNAKRLYNYPDPDAKRLRLQLSKQHKINPESIICGNGSTELIYLVARALRPERVLIPAPTFSEYERACRISNKLRVMSYELKKEDNFDINTDTFIEALEQQNSRGPRKVADFLGQRTAEQPGENTTELLRYCSNAPVNLAFLCNPNNPTGRALKKTNVIKIADASRKLKCYLIIDEAFIDFVPEESVIKEVEKNPYLIVLRSLTKFYALSGLRIGYGVFPLNIIETIKNHKEPWTVNTLAQTAGVAVFNDAAFKKKTFRVIKREKDFLEKGFKRLEISYIPSEANYYLLRINHAKEIISALRNKGIIVRDCSNFKGLDGAYIRIAVKSREDNMRLLNVIARLMKSAEAISKAYPEQSEGNEILRCARNDR